jgi:hypothetical protein
MIHYIHCHIGEPPPSYLLDSCLSIKIVDADSIIYLITDMDVSVENVVVLKVKDIITDETAKVMQMELFKNESNPLWRTSIFRIFLVRDAMKYLKIQSCYHFDSDVLLFQPSCVFDYLLSDFDGLYITPCNSDELVFGFSRFGGILKIDSICEILCNIIFDEKKQKKYSVGMPNEMQLLAGISKQRPDLIKKLKTIPSLDATVVFDPSSYGQYFGGTHQGHLPGWYGLHHDIGMEIEKGNLIPMMINSKPNVKYNENLYLIVNLHIHSKKTKLFI